MILPIVLAITLKVLVTPASDGIQISGALIYFTIKMPIQDFPITESQINSWAVMLTILFLCLFLTRHLDTKNPTARQHAAEWIVEKCEGLVHTNMDAEFNAYGPFIAAIMALSAFSSLLSLFGMYAPTSDINVVSGWAILVFFLITHYKLKCGVGHYLKSFASPALLTPLNVISEIATPISMAFRHYGNVLSGSVISVLIGYALTVVSNKILGFLPGFLSEIPIFRVGLPAVLSLYFDIFSGLLQAYIFAMLTMLYVNGAFPAEDYAKKRRKKQQAGKI